MCQITWIKYECDKGNRWVSVQGGVAQTSDGDPCVFSGCKPGHKIHIRGTTTSIDEAKDWFRNMEWEEVPDTNGAIGS